MLPLIQIKNLTVDFPGSDSVEPVLQNISFSLNRGEMLAIVGESGSGKSVLSLTLMRLLSKAARVVQGSVIFSPNGGNEMNLIGLTENKYRSLRGSEISMIFQEPMTSLNPVMTCGEQICEPLILHKKLKRSAARKEAILLLKKVKIAEPERVFEKFPHQLSGGQKQRVMIAMAVSCKPALLICDEPTTALDVRVQKTILDLLKELCKSENMGMLFITHDLGLVADMADRALVMLRGKIVEEGNVDEIFSHPGHPYTKGLLLCRPSLHKKGERLPVVSDFLNNQMSDNGHLDLKTINHSVKSNEVIPKEREILIGVKGLHLRYSSGKTWLGKEKYWIHALQDVHFDIYKGETLGLVGESGSGKSTLGRALLGLNKPFEGSISYGGKDVMTMSRADLLDFRRNIQIVFQDPYSSLNPRLSIGPAIAEPLKVHHRMSSIQRNERVKDLLKKVELKPEFFDRYPHAFSGGQRQRIVIARALILNPGFVVFDESVSALDVSVQAQVLNLINDLKEKLGFTAVFISHDLSVVRYLCDRVIIMEKGRIIESGDVETVYNYPVTSYTKSLISAIPGTGVRFEI